MFELLQIIKDNNLKFENDVQVREFIDNHFNQIIWSGEKEEYSKMSEEMKNRLAVCVFERI